MKNSVKSINSGALLIVMLLLFIINPVICYIGAKSGLNLWFNTILPTLLPFMIISNMIVNVYSNGFKNPFLYIIFVGVFCGYPMAAHTASQMYEKNIITKEEAEILSGICNNSSLAFVINYIIISTLDCRSMLIPILIIIYLPVFIMLFAQCRKFSRHKNIMYTENTFTFEIVDNAVMNGFQSILKLGGYIMMFSIFASFIWTLNISPVAKSLLTGITEITSGISFIAAADIPASLKTVLILTINSFGGLSCLFQTKSMIHPDLSIKKYIYYKLLQSALTMITATAVIYVL